MNPTSDLTHLYTGIKNVLGLGTPDMTGNLRIGTANLDWAKSKGEHKEYLAYLTERHDILFVQEAKFINLRRDGLPDGWTSNQRVASAATRGSAICWNKAVTYVHNGGLALGAIGGDVLPRYMCYGDIPDNTNRHTTLIACHYPPLRDKKLWPQYDRHLAHLIDLKAPHASRIIVGGDMNGHASRIEAAINKLVKPQHQIIAKGDGAIDMFLLYNDNGTVKTDETGKDHRWTDHPTVTLTTHK